MVEPRTDKPAKKGEVFNNDTTAYWSEVPRRPNSKAIFRRDKFGIKFNRKRSSPSLVKGIPKTVTGPRVTLKTKSFVKSRVFLKHHYMLTYRFTVG